MEYRRDIDGLRTIAVVPVVIYHSSYPIFSGGFVGVDVFFVISGFLITGLIAEQIENQRWSFANFYTRRVRRLLPALVGVALFTMWLAHRYFTPQDFDQYLDTLIGMFAFTNNYVFMMQSDYFAEAAATKPLLHTWSLAVEEQFYLILPVVLFVFLKRTGRSGMILLLTIFGTASFLGALTAMRLDWFEQAFFNSAFRFWELLIGSVLALAKLPKLSSSQAAAARISGLSLILYAAVAYSHNTEFPGLTAVLPVIGTVLLIFAGPLGNDLVLKTLKTPIFVYTGKISYSLYLWHWPLFVSVRFIAPDNALAMPLAIACSFVAASISYHIIETPLRFGPILKTPKRAFSFLAVISAAALGSASYAKVTDVAASRFSADKVEFLTYIDTDRAKTYWQWSDDQCDDRIPGLPRNKASCLTIENPSASTTLLIGDSHAQDLLHGMQSRWPERNYISIMAGGCKPIRHYEEDRAACEPIRNFLYEEFDAWDQVDQVIIGVRMNEDVLPGVIETAEWIKSNKRVDDVAIVGPRPEYAPPVDEIIPASLNFPTNALIERVRSALNPDSAIFSQYVSTAIPQGIRYIDTYEIFCGEGACKVLIDNTIPIVLDYGHYTPEGSVWFVEQWDPIKAR